MTHIILNNKVPDYLINDFKEMLSNVEIDIDNDKKVEIEQIGLYDPSTIFQFYSKSPKASKSSFV